MKASDLLVRCLENEGVRYIFGVPGEENLDLLESIRISSIKFITTRHEQAAAFMAATCGRLTGKPGVVLSTLGPGATNLLTGLAYAQLGGMPLIAITGQKAVHTHTQGLFQLVDTVAISKPLTKFATKVESAQLIAKIVRNAFRQATEERPGVSLIELPEDVAKEIINDQPLPVTEVRRPSPDAKALNSLTELIYQASQPLLLLGAGANRKRIASTLQQFIEKSGIYFVTTQMGKGVLDERNEKYLGCVVLSENDYANEAIKQSDLLITVGYDLYEKPSMNIDSLNKSVVSINFTSGSIDPNFVPTMEIVGDIANSINLLAGMVSYSPNWELTPFRKLKDELDRGLSKHSDAVSYPIVPQRLVAELRKAIPEDGILALDNGVYKLWVARNYQTYSQNTLLLDNALATMGAGLPSAIAAKILNPHRKVVALCGDGGFMMNSQEIETAIRLGLDLVVLIVRDDAFGMIEWKQAEMGFERFGLSFDNPDFIKFAEAFGAKGYRVTKAEDMSRLLASIIDAPGVHIVDVPIDYTENHKVFSKELFEKKFAM